MKKYVALCLAMLLVLSLAACNVYVPNEQDTTSDLSETTVEEATVDETTADELTSEETTAEEITADELTSEETTAKETTAEGSAVTLLKGRDAKNITVSSLPAGYNYAFDGEKADAIVSYLTGLSLTADFPENPNEYAGMTWVIFIEYENGDTETVYHFGNMFIGTEESPWYRMKSDEAIQFESLLERLSTESAEQTVEASGESLLKAWTGAFDEDTLKETIIEYQNNCTPIALDGNDKIAYVLFATDFDIAGGSVSRLSHTDATDINVELNGYIDLAVDIRCEGNRITINTDWWYGDDGWVQNHPVWSYLVRLQDGDGTSHYYYFRIAYAS